MKAAIQKTVHEKAQGDFQRWADAMKIMGTLRSVQVDHWDPQTERLEYTTGIHWDFGAVSVYSGIHDNARLMRALLFLVSQGWILQIRREYRAQPFGLVEYEAISKRPEIDTGAAYIRFRDEALTGTDSAGKQSALTRVALPNGSRAESPRNRVEEAQLKRCVEVEFIHRIALENGCRDDNEAMDKLATGEIHKCCRCGRQKAHHAANEKNGKKWQSGCITCRKMKP